MFEIPYAIYRFWREQRLNLAPGWHLDQQNNITFSGNVAHGKITVLQLHKFLQQEMDK